MMTDDYIYTAEVIFGPNLGIDRMNADVLHDQVDMDGESYAILGKSEIIEYNPRGVKFKERPEVKECIHGVDILLAETIAILNRKGYVTDACCQGHLPFNNSIYQVDARNDDKLKDLLESVEAGRTEIIQIKDNIYYFATGTIKCWIRFDEKTALPYLPKDFDLSRIEIGGNNQWGLSTIISSYYVDNGESKKKSAETSAQELIEIHKNLVKWAYSLPPVLIDYKDQKTNFKR